MNRIQPLQCIEQASEKEELGEAANRFVVDDTDFCSKLTAQNGLIDI